MSGILGLVSRTGALVDQVHLQAMSEAMAGWGPDGRRLWQAGAAGLGQLVLFNTPEAVREALPRWLPEPGLAFTAEARLDNRDELGERLGLAAPERSTLPDGDLLLRAYLKWGAATPDQILGDWSFAAWHPAERKLFLARDHQGNTALYYYADARICAFASSLKALLAVPGVPRQINELRLAQVLIAWQGDGAQTFFEQMFSLPPAHTLTVTPERVDKRRYWYLEHTPELRLKSAAEYADGLREVLTEAVRCRLRSLRPVGVTLSGGLDSGSVSTLAAGELAQRGQRLPAFTSVPLYDVANTVGPYRFGDETPYVEAVAAHMGNIDVQFLRAENVSPVGAMRRALDFQGVPGHAAANYYWMDDLLAAARQQGVGTLLTGQGGNATISWLGKPWLSPGRASEQMRDWGLRLKFELLLPLLPAPLLLWRERRQARQRRWDNAAIQPDWAQRLHLTEQWLAADDAYGEHAYQVLRDPKRMRYTITEPGRSQLGQIWAEWGAAFALEVRDPTLDRRVMTYCLGVPNRYYTGPAGEDRYLLRQAMEGRLPPSVLHNPRRGRQAADLVARLLAHGPEMEAALAELEQAPAVSAYISLPKLRQAWTSLAENKPTQREYNRAVMLLTRGLMAGLFVARWSEMC